MLGFFSNKSDHPLANLKSAQQLLEGLPKNDAVEVLQEIAHWIEALNDPENEFRLDHQYAVLRLLDDAAHPFLRKIMHSYFAAVPPAAFQENRLWGAMNVYFTFSELGYLNLLRGIRDGGKGASAIRSFLPLIIARGIYAVSGRLESAAVRYAPVDEQLWAHLAEFYAEAEAQKCQEEMQAVYSGPGEAASIHNLFASLLMWYTSGVGSFRPLDLHIARRLITHMSKSFAIDRQCAADSLFSFDLAHPGAPTRVKEAGTMYPPSMRFVSVGGAPKLFDNMLRTLSKHLVPEELNLGTAYSADMVSEVARQLSACCNAPLPVRRHTRRKIKVNVNVANGFSKVVEQTAVDFYLDLTPSETWEVEDISATGFRCVLPAARASNVKIGALVGLQPEQVTHWGVGIVRRLSRDAQQNLHVGIEMLSSKVQGVVLHDNDGMRRSGAHSALFLGNPEMQSGEGMVLMQADSYSGSRRPTMKIDEKIYLLLPLALVEKGEDFDLTRYRMMQQETSGEGAF